MDGWITACVFAGKLWRRRTVVQAPQGDGRPCATQMEQWKPCLVKPCYSWRYSTWSQCKSEVWHSITLLIEIDWQSFICQTGLKFSMMALLQGWAIISFQGATWQTRIVLEGHRSFVNFWRSGGYLRFSGWGLWAVLCPCLRHCTMYYKALSDMSKRS